MAVPLKPMSLAADMREEVMETLLSYLEVCPISRLPFLAQSHSCRLGASCTLLLLNDKKIVRKGCSGSW